MFFVGARRRGTWALFASAVLALHACDVVDDVVATREVSMDEAGGSAGVGGAVDIGGAPGMAGDAGSAGQAAGYPCALPSEPAFCDPLDVPAPGGRASDLDETLWNVSRRSQAIDTTGGPFVGWRPFETLDCAGDPTTVEPGDDFEICPNGSRKGLRDSLFVGSSSWNSQWQRSISPWRPFDFANRTGTIAFDLQSLGAVSGDEPISSIEFWLTRDPLGAVVGDGQFPPDALEIHLENGSCPQGQFTVSAYSSDEDSYELLVSTTPTCFDFESTQFVHFELRVSKTEIEVLATDPGAGELHRIALFPASLSFSRGYLHLVHSSGAVGTMASVHELRWANVGFDGPRRAIGRSYFVADALEPWMSQFPEDPQNQAGWVSMGFQVQQVDPVPLTIADVDPTGATRAWLSLDVFPVGSPVSFRLNGGNWQNFNTYLGLGGGVWVATAVPIEPSLLVDGDNTIEFLSQGANIAIANIKVHVE